MSLSPGNILQKLQDIRNWQHNEGIDLFKKIQKNSHNQTTQSDYETIDGISMFDDDNTPSSQSRYVDDIDKKPITTPRKEFTELLEDKLKECGVDKQQTMVINRPKQPFLRKGSGLRRFRLTPDDCRVVPKAVNRRKSENRSIETKTPLKAPDFEMIKPKASWTTVVENPRNNNELSLPSEQTLYEEILEKELKIFEMIEQKVENASFCSTSSSILRIFTVSPQKNQKIDKSVQFNDQTDNNQPDNNPNIDINGLLQHLNRKIKENSTITQSSPAISDDESNCSSCYTISSTDLETTISNKTQDIGVNCNLIDVDKKIIELERINDGLRSKIDDITREYQLEMNQLLAQINEGKQKTKIKNQNTTKERELIKNLKQELNDLKETIKLKDTKNGTTQARLRNQIKQLEKDKNNLNNEIDKLSKENAKLKALEKLNQTKSCSKDTKILNKINDNIHKLIENNKKSDNCKDNDDSLMNFTNFKINDCIEKAYDNVFKEKIKVNHALNDSNKTNRIETILDDGSKEIKYGNGNLKIISSDGNTIIMKYYNGDIKQTSLIDGVIKYYYNDKNIWQITDSEGVELIEYPEGHKEKRYPDGKCEIIYPDGILQQIYKTGEQHIQYPDGSILTIDKNGDKILNLPNGQKEIETKEHKRREYPDGTIKFIYNNGIQETRYSNGRIRKRDVDGVLIFDNFA